jgi:uncharacterized protein (DUF433 family)
MQLEDYFEFSGPNEINIKGHRIWIEDVLYEYIHGGMTVEELAKRFPTLTLEQIHAVVLYYLHNKEAMDKYLADWLEYCRLSREENVREHGAWYERMRRLKAERGAQQQAQTAP